MIPRHRGLNIAAWAGVIILAFTPKYLRNPLLLVGAGTVGGCMTGDYDALPMGYTGWKTFTGEPTIWSWLLWAVAAGALATYFERLYHVRKYNRGRATEAHTLEAMVAHDQIVEEEAHNGVVSVEEPPPAPRRRNRPQTPQGATGSVSEDSEGTPTTPLWLPSNHVPHRRVRRGGETLTGTPIKDRRTVDPRNL